MNQKYRIEFILFESIAKLIRNLFFLNELIVIIRVKDFIQSKALIY